MSNRVFLYGNLPKRSQLEMGRLALETSRPAWLRNAFLDQATN
jgi:hypothetical protein